MLKAECCCINPLRESTGHPGVKRPQRGGDSSDKSNDRCPAWHPGIPGPPMHAREKALDAALQKLEELIAAKKPAFAKVCKRVIHV